MINTVPELDEIEVSVFGPGYGESILLHVGGNNWFIIDSCLDPISKEPAALVYLQKLNIDPKTSVKQVIATHWHDDHIRGMSEIVKACTSAKFVCSNALGSTEFHILVQAYGKRLMIESSGVNEFRDVLEILKERTSRISQSRYIGDIEFVGKNTLLWEWTIVGEGFHYECKIRSLSPSSAAFQAAQSGFSEFLPQIKDTKRRLIATGPNRSAVVLRITAGKCSILLGSDLEEVGDSQDGWSAIINSTTRPSEKASFFKIPHHGSQNAHHPEVWATMLNSDPVAVLTPNVRGNRLPTKEDVNRICGLTNKAYTTANFTKKRKINRDRTVEKTIKETARSIRPLHTSFGHVRFRVKQDGSHRIELFSDASLLNNLTLH